MDGISRKILEVVAHELSAVSPSARKESISTTLAELLNASGILMDGGTVQSSLPQSPELVQQIAELLENRPTPSRNKYYIYPFARPSISASGPFYYIDAKTGELYVLLVRRVKDPHQWLYPAGYMEVMPANAEMIYKDRVSEIVRNKAEEATIGVHLDIPDDVENINQSHEKFILPDARDVQYIVYEEFRRLVSAEGFNIAIGKISDVSYLKQLLKRHRVEWPEHIDFSSKSTFIRETFEEAGLDISNYPDAIIKMAKSIDIISIGSGGERLYNTDQNYFAYLGILESAPPLKPGAYEACEAKWIAVSDIYHASERNQYIVKDDGRPMHFHGIQGIEYTLTELLNLLLSKVSKVAKPRTQKIFSLFQNAPSIQAALMHQVEGELSEINWLEDLPIGYENSLPSLIDTTGQGIFRSFIAAAWAIAAKKDEKEIAEIIRNTRTKPSELLNILSKCTVNE